MGTTTYTYSLPGAGLQVFSENGPWSNDTVTVTNIHGLRSGLVIQQPTGSWTTTYAYDTARRLTGVTGGSQTWSYNYTPAPGSAEAAVAAGLLIEKVTLPSSHRIDNTFNSLGLLTDTSLKTSGGTLRNRHGYTHDANHRRTMGSRTNSTATGWNGRFDYTYDASGQLESAWTYNAGGSPITSQKWGYAYDPSQNLIRQTNNTTTTSFTVNALNQMTAFPLHTQTFNRQGNLTQRSASSTQQRYFVYDHENQLIEVRSDTYYTPESSRFKEEYVYDGLGRLRERKTWTHYYGNWAASTTYRYIYDGMLIVQERTPTNPSVTYTRGVDLSGSLAGAGGIGGLLGRSTGYNSGTGAWSTHTSYHADGNGNVTAILDTSGNLTASYHYNPWGGLLGITGSHATANTMRHSSKPWFAWRGSNSAGLTYFGYRFYDPTTMRWVNRDPIGETGGINLYGFVGNMPTSHVDPSGLHTWVDMSSLPTYSGPSNWPSYMTALDKLMLEAALFAAPGPGMVLTARFAAAAWMARFSSKVPRCIPPPLGCPPATNAADKFSRTPKSLMDQMVLDAAKQGKGTKIIDNLGDLKFKGMEKWSYTEKSAAGLRSEVHYVRNPKTGKLLDFKFKHHAETCK